MIASRILQYSIWPAHYAWNGAPYTIAMVRNKLLQSNKTAIKQPCNHVIFITILLYLFHVCGVYGNVCHTLSRSPIVWWLVVIHTLSAQYGSRAIVIIVAAMGFLSLWLLMARWMMMVERCIYSCGALRTTVAETVIIAVKHYGGVEEICIDVLSMRGGGAFGVLM